MPFSHHSHSGQFCTHAVDTLEEMVQTAISKGFQSFALTEHMPRPREDFYPEEEKDYTVEGLAKLFDDFVVEATRLRDVYSSKISILIGFESDWIRPSTQDIIRGLLEKHGAFFDFFVGSIHHVFTIPIDFNDAFYQKARDEAGGTDERLFEAYFNEQDQMLRSLRPLVVGHFDLIRLKSDNPNTEFEGMSVVWEKIHQNLEFISSYGGFLELNSAALRKGLAQPYPCLPICQMFLSMQGRFVLSDDSHGTDQVGTNYPRLLEFIQRAGIKEIHYANRTASSVDVRFPHTGFRAISVSQLERLLS
ncbi:histidinol-phosphatase [Lophiostoma macrostomum CBS 122681]|uniref:Histidinol-phosphatase n=1 Tax=Lophiostoma macrostomum CBS 122681 TaxID=1314788 RepID=A0A6A6STU4_9PLEO|nr:histidinol-phosphatase [Lophiostoma macrostomum CBS 122681]